MRKSGFSRAIGDLKRVARDPLLLAAGVLTLAALILFVVYPILSVAIQSLKTDSGYSLKTYGEVVASAYLRKAFWNSLRMSALTALAGTLVGFVFAFAVTRANVPLKKFLNAVAIIPIVSPPFIGALAIIMLFGNNGLVTWNLLKIQNFPIYGFNGLFLAQVVTFFPVSYMTLKGVLESMNPVLEDAALNLGGSRLKVFLKVTLPLAFPGIASSILLLFVETLADFGNPLILAGSKFPILSVQAYLEIVGMYDLPKGAALSVFLLAPSLIAFLRPARPGAAEEIHDRDGQAAVIVRQDREPRGADRAVRLLPGGGARRGAHLPVDSDRFPGESLGLRPPASPSTTTSSSSGSDSRRCATR